MRNTFFIQCICVFALLFTTTAAHAQQMQLTDKQATKETVNLFRNMQILREKGFMFGHQDDLAYGVEWRYEKGRSDVKEVAGDYPAVYGWELGGIEVAGQSVNLDSVPFDKMKQFIKDGYQRGGVITLSWHAQSPLGKPKGAWDITHGSVASILPNGEKHTMYLQWLDRVADFVSSLRDKNGEAIPVLFRPFHELTGNWFWWCQNVCTVEEYKFLWRFTRQYLQVQKNLHNLIWVYNTAGDFNTEQEYLERYPGDDVVDIISFDTYQHGDASNGKDFAEKTQRRLALIGNIAAQKSKLFALAETGYEQVPFASWWTKTLLDAIGNNKISYVLLWRNHGYHADMKKLHYYAPYSGQVSADDFRVFYKMSNTLFEKDAKRKKMYK